MSQTSPETEPVAWTNEAQLGYLKDRNWSEVPMAMWAKPSGAADIPLYRGHAQTPAVLSEQQRHAVGHARYQVEHSTPENPECCFDYELVATLIGIIDRTLSDTSPIREVGK